VGCLFYPCTQYPNMSTSCPTAWNSHYERCYHLHLNFHFCESDYNVAEVFRIMQSNLFCSYRVYMLQHFGEFYVYVCVCLFTVFTSLFCDETNSQCPPICF